MYILAPFRETFIENGFVYIVTKYLFFFFILTINFEFMIKKIF